VKEEFIEKLICPECKNNDLSLEKVAKENQFEILYGIIKCQSCFKQYFIKDGILNLLLNHEIQQKYDPDGSKNLTKTNNYSQQKIFGKSEIAKREDLDQKWVKSSTANLNQVFDSLQLTGKEDVLELGAGTCWALQKFAEFGCKCVALDILQHNKLEMADFWLTEKNIYFERILADMNQSIFCDNSFDLVYSIASIMYSENILKTFHEINRILKRGGKMALIAEPIVPIYKSKGTFKLPGSGYAYTIFKWDQNIKKAGFKIIKRYFAESIKMRFEEPDIITKKNRWYYTAAKFIHPLFKIGFIRNFNLDCISWLWSVFLPIPLLLIAEKKE